MRKPAWQSRKFWVAVGTIIATLATEIAGIDLDPESIITLVVAAAAYIIGESWVDTRK